LKYRGSLSVLVEDTGLKEINVIGAPEAVLEKTSHILGKNRIRKIRGSEIQDLLAQTQELASQAMRVLALAYKKVPSDVDNLTESLVK
jgi:Ca2+-transporting ATPase